MSIIGCTGDWFGGWDGLTPGSVDQFITADLKGGRLPEVIARNEPAIMVCHWPGIYFNGQEIGFGILRDVVRRLEAAYDNLAWMKLSEIARYWAARELTRIEQPSPEVLAFQAPFHVSAIHTPALAGRPVSACTEHRGEVDRSRKGDPALAGRRARRLVSGTFRRRDQTLLVCFDLPKGASRLELTAG